MSGSNPTSPTKNKMSLPKKKSRKITIKEVDYRWMLSFFDMKWKLIVEKVGGKSKLITTIPWKETSDLRDLEIYNNEPITPEDAELIILSSLKEGWNPDTSGDYRR